MVKKSKPKKKIVKKLKPQKKVKAVKVAKKKVKKISSKKNLKSKQKTKTKIKNKKLVLKIIKKKILPKVLKSKKKIIPKKKKAISKKNINPEIKLKRRSENPIISPRAYSWESQGAFNPAAIYTGGKVHLFYRALGNDGISRIGYASSDDGINFDTRLSYPVYIAENKQEAQKHWPFTTPARLVFDPDIYTSGGGWGGCEDPRTVLIDGNIYMTFNMFNGWDSMRVAVTSIKEENLNNQKWIWEGFSYLSRGNRQKNWVLFPEKINGKFALFYNLDKGDPDRVHIAFINQLNILETPSKEEALDPQLIPDHEVAWHYRTRSAACPPIKTKDGWLLIYHAMDKKEPNRYKVGAMLLDLKNPEKVLYRAQNPILEPDEWYENDYKPGIVYANGAIVKDGTLFVYYGGGDKYVGVATINLNELLEDLKNSRTIKLKTSKSIVK